MITAGVLLAAIAAAAAAVPELPVAERCAIVSAVLDSKAKMPLSGMRTVDVRFPDIAGVRNRVSHEGRPLVRTDWRVGSDYRPVFVSAELATCGGAAFTLVSEGTQHPVSTRELALLVTITPVAHRPLRFAFEETLGRNPSFRFDTRVGGVAIPGLKYSGFVEKRASGIWAATVTEARFAE